MLRFSHCMTLVTEEDAVSVLVGLSLNRSESLLATSLLTLFGVQFEVPALT